MVTMTATAIAAVAELASTSVPIAIEQQQTVFISTVHPYRSVVYRRLLKSNNILMIWLIIIASIINTSTSQSPTSSTTTTTTGHHIEQYVIPSLIPQYQPFNFRPQQYQSSPVQHRYQQVQQQQQQKERQQQPPPQDNNIFRQINSFIQARQRNATEIAGNVFFKYYNSDGELDYESNLQDPDFFHLTKCNPNGQFAILLHGWRESCDTRWMKQLIEKVGRFRGGCIICMDYSRYASESYVRLVRIFEPIVQILTLKLLLLDYVGFKMNDGYMFGFSYGGQMATEAGRRIGHKRLKEIDTCDMAGPGFDHRTVQPDHRDAAQNVQCIHTSRDKGTRFYNCHQDWRLGNCGLTQIASNSPPLGSHGLCPYMYVNAFEHDFFAVEKPFDCISKRAAKIWPSYFKMGYMEKRKREVTGELFAHTSKSHPFNLISNGTENVIPREQYRVQREQRDDDSEPNNTVLHRLKQKLLKYVFYDMNFF